MKKLILISLVLSSIATKTFSQNNIEFPHSVLLSDINEKKYNSNSFNNNDNPIIVDFWAIYCKPCIAKYNTFKSIYTNWQEKTGAKIIIVSVDKENRVEMAKKLISDSNWPFEAYFDINAELLTKLKRINQLWCLNYLFMTVNSI